MAAGLVMPSRLLLGLAGAVVVFLTLLSAGGVRGSDQYWYVADVESIARGEGAFTNAVFPRSLLRAEAAPPLRPIHHHPLLYLVALPAALLGAYGAWLLLNVGWVLATALLVRSLLAREVGEPLANATAAVFAVLPAAFWQATQPLVDAWIALLVMLCVWSLCRREPAAGRWPIAWAGLLVAALCREFFALPLLLLPLLYWLWSEAPRRRRAAWAGVMLVLAVTALAAKAQLFPQQIDFSLAAAWRQLASRGHGMFLYFDLGQGPPAPIGELLAAAGARLTRALGEHLLPPWRQAVFYLPFNLLALVAVSGWWSRDRRAVPPRLLLIATALVVLHLAAITIQHPSYRYGFTITAPLLVAAVLRLRNGLRGVPGLAGGVAATLLVGGFAVDLALAAKSRREGVEIAELTAASRPVLERVIAAGEAVVFEAQAPAPGVWYLWAGHALPASTVLYLEPGTPYDAATYARLRRRSGARWLICHRKSPLRAVLDADSEPAAWLPEPAAGWAVYRLPRPGPG